MSYEEDLEKRNEELEELVSELYNNIEDLELKSFTRGNAITSLARIFTMLDIESKHANIGQLRECVLDAIHRFKMIVEVNKDGSVVIVHDEKQTDVINNGWTWGDKESDRMRWEREYEDYY